MAHPFGDKHNVWHHSPASTQKCFAIDLWLKQLKANGITTHYGSPVAVGRAGEDYAKAILVDGHPPESAIRHATSILDEHQILPWDAVADEARLEIHRGDVLQAISINACEGVKEALKKANQITGQEKLEKNYPGLTLPFLGFSDFYGGNRVAELKIRTSSVDTKTKLGRRAGALPGKPDFKHVGQVAYYADVLGCPASLIYASEKDYRIFDESNCEELTPEGMKRAVDELRARAWSRENIMRCAPDWRTLMQMLAPDFSDWGWRIDPEHLAEARKVWGIK